VVDDSGDGSGGVTSGGDSVSDRDTGGSGITSGGASVAMSSPADPAPTRRDGGGPPIQVAWPDPTPTRRDLPVPAVAVTRHDADDSSRRGGHGATKGGSGASATVQLPAELAARFRVVAAPAQHGAEADVIRVQDASGQQLMIKLYRPEISPDPDVWRALPQLRTANLVRVHETGEAGGRSYEVMEYLSGGNLRALTGQRFESGTITEVVRQLTAALATLHAANITHRDIKPENVLLRSHDSYRQEFVLTDFGLSRHLDQSMIFSTAARTLIYTAPETFYDHVSVARDWWSLGVIVHELATGKRPFEGLSEHPIMMQLARHAFPVDDVEDPRIRLLCRGLLVHDFESRWGLKQVQQWLDGESPAVPRNRGPADQPTAGVRPFLFLGEHYTEPRVLALAMAQNWQVAARQHFARMGEHWNDLRNWLAQFDDPDRFDVAGRREMVDELTDPGSPDGKLLRLLTWLDPKLPPTYKGFAVAPKHIVGLGMAAASGDAKSAMVIDELWSDGLLPVLAQFAGAGELTEVDARWRELHDDFDKKVAQLAADVPRTVDRTSDPDALKWARAVLLAQAAAPASVTEALRHQVHHARARMPTRVPWFDAFVAEMGQAPQRVIIGALIGPIAVAEAEDAIQERNVKVNQVAARYTRWQQQEQHRRAGRSGALTSALAGLGIVLVPWLIYLAALSATTLASTTLGVLGLLTIVVGAVAELGLAWRLGAGYSPDYSLLWQLRLVARRVGSLMQLEGTGKELYIAAAGVTLLIIVTVLVPVVVPVLVTIAHLIWVWRRERTWAHSHVREQREALGRP
jgi:tRNA A-37 threonylcarbamoyl transferase component Bud32